MRRRIGIFWKYFIVYSLISSVVILIFSIFISSIIQKRYQEVSYKELKGYALLANKEFENAFDISLAEANELTMKVSRQTGFRITFILPDGKVISDSERKPEEMENHFDRPEFQVALSGEIGSSIRYSNTLKTKMSYVAIPIYEGGKVKGVVRLSIRSQLLETFAKSVSRSVILISIIIWLITLILTFLFSSLFSSSVNELVNLTRNYAQGNFSKRGNIRSRDELSEINAGLNEMSRRLQYLFNQLQSQRDESNAIINSMTEGVLVLDKNLYVRVANDSFKSMFSLDNDVLNKSYIETLRLVSIKEMIDELISEGQVKSKRIEFGGKSIQGNGIVIKRDGKDTDGLVLVFHDITADTQLERIKADFVANASHELRTPLTAIKGYLETLEDEDPETQKSFIQIIRRNVNRISNLVSDLLLLSRLESPVPQTDIEPVDLLNIAENVRKLVERMAKEKNLNLRIDIQPNITVNGDAFLLEQMILNLLDNAVKYTEQGEISLRASREKEKVIIQVSDTGIGIPQKHLPRIFERFYRVDKARSRDLGGTGLGLAIVKHIVQLHNGEIYVESHVGRGTIFTIQLQETKHYEQIPGDN